MTSQLSNKAQAVLDSFRSSHLSINNLSAALRTVADQVTPWQSIPTEESITSAIDYEYAWALFSKANDIRQEILSIADELDSL